MLQTNTTGGDEITIIELKYLNPETIPPDTGLPEIPHGRRATDNLKPQLLTMTNGF